MAVCWHMDIYWLFYSHWKSKRKREFICKKMWEFSCSRKTPLGTTVLWGEVPCCHPELCSPQYFSISECGWRTHRVRLLKIYLLGERTMLQGQSEGKTQRRAKCLTLSLPLFWLSSISPSSLPFSTLFSPPGSWPIWSTSMGFLTL